MKGLLLLVCFGFLMVACAPSPDNTPRQPRIEYFAPHERIYDFYLEDGTRCVYVDGVREGGLSCDFKTK